MIDLYPDADPAELEEATEIFAVFRERGYKATEIDITIDGGGEYHVEVSGSD